MMRQGMRRWGVMVGMLAAVTAWAPGVAQAVPVTYEFSGTVYNLLRYGPSLVGVVFPAPGVATGDIISGSFTYEADTPRSSDGSYYGAITNLTFAVGGMSGYHVPDSGYSTSLITVRDNPSGGRLGGDGFSFGQIVDGPLFGEYRPQGFDFGMGDSSANMLSSYTLPMDLTLAFAAADNVRTSLQLRHDSTGYTPWFVQSNITSLTRVSSVPEPSSLLLLGLGMLSLMIWQGREWRRSRAV